MRKTILVVGYGPGISTAVAERFGSAGYAVALVARNAEKLAVGVAALEGKGIARGAVGAFAADAADPASIRAAIASARSLGPIGVVHWNAYGGGEIGDLVSTPPDQALRVFDVAVTGLLATVQATLADLKESKDGAVLVTNGAFGDVNPQVDAFAVKAGYMGLALGNAAKHKLVGLLAERLKNEGVYVGEVVVAGRVKGTAWDSGNATIDPAAVAAKFWELFRARDDIRARIRG